MFLRIIIRSTVTLALILTCVCGISQNSLQEINKINSAAVALAPLRFLASDELMGRGTSRPEINIAARYISEEFKSFGLKEIPGTSDYFQQLTIKMFTPAKAGALSLNKKKYIIGNDIVQINGTDVSLNAPLAYVHQGMKDDLDKMDVKGKIIISDWNSNDTDSPGAGFDLIPIKLKWAQEHGAGALILLSPKKVNWEDLKNYYMQERTRQERDNLSTFIIHDNDSLLLAVSQVQLATLSSVGNVERDVSAKNVMGWVEGTSAKLKDEFIVLSAHYDHLGVAEHPKEEEGKIDSIYNGARDNGIGTTAVIDAARYFAQHPPKRSIVFIAFTAEELGLVGSKYFAEHPVLGLKKLVYDLNIDNASYNDTTIITLVGLGRTSADADIKKACAFYGLSILPDPTKEQWLFNGSDNLPLAEKGIPAVTFSLGMRTFDSTIFNRYHQLSDEVGNFNLNYAVKFINAFILSAKYVADDDKEPTWKKGDKYEAAWKVLHH